MEESDNTVLVPPGAEQEPGVRSEVVREGHGSRSRHLAPGSRLEQEAVVHSVEHLAQHDLLFLDLELELVELACRTCGLVSG